jgi:nitrite reductase/ring-hydroxylating ferredoxin subunit
VRRFVADLLRGRRPRRFRVEDSEVDELRTAILLRAARPGSGAPREEFVTDLHRRLAAELARDEQSLNPQPRAQPPAAVDHSRRRLVQAASIAAGAAAIGAGADHLLTQRTAPANGDGGNETLTPNTGQWRTVVASADLPEGGVQGFDLGTVIGFVARTAGELGAVSGVCTHLGCRLALNAASRRLDCPCHNASFALGGQLLHYQLAVPPRALPHLEVREVDGAVQVFAPGPTT